MSVPLTGSCLCGAIRYRIDTSVSELRACHCRHCQKASGTSGSVNAVVPASAFAITQGAPKRYDAKAESGRTLHRYFCGDCGSPIYSKRATEHNDLVVVRAGSLDNPPGELKITAHIWTSRAQPWAYIDPASKQMERQAEVTR